jgi:hypothetical protein
MYSLLDVSSIRMRWSSNGTQEINWENNLEKYACI